MLSAKRQSTKLQLNKELWILGKKTNLILVFVNTIVQSKHLYFLESIHKLNTYKSKFVTVI